MKETDSIVQQLKAYLFDQGAGEPSPEIKQLLQRYPSLRELVREMQDETTRKDALTSYEAFSRKAALTSEQRMLEKIRARIADTGTSDKISSKRPTSNGWKYGIAASIILLGLIGFWIYPRPEPVSQMPETLSSSTIRPGTNKAVLTLADGTTLPLSTDHKKIVVGQEIAYEDGSRLSMKDILDYTPYLTLQTPKGGQYQVVLPDGTQVWLNAASSLHYPSRFDSRQRTVQLQGEAYFEVAPDQERPFIVQTDYEEIQVLGTHFNVSAYQEEPESRVALLEGQVRVRVPGSKAHILKPGQQSIVHAGSLTVEPVHVSESIAWKNGAFNFNNENLEKVMRKLARWYDIEYELDPEVKTLSVWGSVSRYEDIEKVLEILKRTQTNIQYKIQGRRVVIRSI